MAYGQTEPARKTGSPLPVPYGSAAFHRFQAAEFRRPERQLEPVWPEVFHSALARLGLGLGWAVGLALVLGVGEAAAFSGSLASLLLLAAAGISRAQGLPVPGRYTRFGVNPDSPLTRETLALWACAALFLASTLFLWLFPTGLTFLRLLLGLDMLALCPLAIAATAAAPRRESCPTWKSPYLPWLYVCSGLAAGCILFTAYGCVLLGDPGPFRLALTLAELFLAGQLYSAYRHLHTLLDLPPRIAYRFHRSPEKPMLAVYAVLAFILPIQLVFMAFFLEGAWLWLFSPAPLLAAASLFLERVLFYRLETARR